MVDACSGELVVLEFSFVVGAIFPFESSFALFFTLDKATFVFYAACLQNLFAKAMLHIVDPRTFIRSIGRLEFSLPVGFVVFPFSHVHVSI